MEHVSLQCPYLIFVGDEENESFAKTARGIVQWRRELCVGQLRLSPTACDLGLPDTTISEAAAAGARSLIIGTALVGGSLPAAWISTLAEAARAGMDLVAGLHTQLSSLPELVKAAAQGGSSLIDVRRPPAGLPVGTGKKRQGKRLLTVGTDCALGKKYTALQLEQDMRRAGFAVDFRATGQTGIMICGSGIAVDAVIADFISGAAETLSPANDPDHWDLIEGQGGIFHPGFAAVSHGLLIGSQPDAFVVCHAPRRPHLLGWPHVPLPTIGEVIERTTLIGRLTNPKIRCVGISLDSSSLELQERETYMEELRTRYALPVADPLLDGTGAFIENL